MPARFFVYAALCSIVPDFDVLGFVFGIRYGDLFGHRGFTHSLLFAVMLGFLAARLFVSASQDFSSRLFRLTIVFTLAPASHGLLDALTAGGLGVAFFSPFDETRYFFPWQPIVVSPIGLGFFSFYGLRVLESEIIWVWFPSILLMLIIWLIRRSRRGKQMP